MQISVQLVVSVLLSAIAAYLIGSINFALVISGAVSKKDIRNYGSGNAGMTNMLRTFGKLPALFTLIGDLGKGVVAILLSRLLFHLFMGVDSFMLGSYIAGVFALLGHVFPVYYGFKGGKGILVTAGILLMIDPIVCGIIFGVFLIVFACSRIISLSSISAAAAYPIATLVLRLVQHAAVHTVVLHTLLSAMIGALVIVLHRGNIKRLLAGEEPKIGQKSKHKN